MKEVSIEKLQDDFIDYVKQNIGVFKSSVKGKPLFYSRGGCHVNSILLYDDIASNNDYKCALVEGIMICGNGMAYDHCWNVVWDEENEPHYLDVTMDAILSDAEREMEKRYYSVKEVSKEEMMERIANNQSLFSEEIHQAIKEYYAVHPEMEAEYWKGKEMVERQ